MNRYRPLQSLKQTRSLTYHFSQDDWKQRGKQPFRNVSDFRYVMMFPLFGIVSRLTRQKALTCVWRTQHSYKRITKSFFWHRSIPTLEQALLGLVVSIQINSLLTSCLTCGWRNLCRFGCFFDADLKSMDFLSFQMMAMRYGTCHWFTWGGDCVIQFIRHRCSKYWFSLTTYLVIG